MQFFEREIENNDPLNSKNINKHLQLVFKA
jgi:hypothetical protein